MIIFLKKHAHSDQQSQGFQVSEGFSVHIIRREAVSTQKKQHAAK